MNRLRMMLISRQKGKEEHLYVACPKEYGMVVFKHQPEGWSFETSIPGRFGSWSKGYYDTLKKAKIVFGSHMAEVAELNN